MFQTIEINIDDNGVIHPLEPNIKLPSGRALLTLLESISYETALLSEQSLAKPKRMRHGRIYSPIFYKI
jgi:hypothetical protein